MSVEVCETCVLTKGRWDASGGLILNAANRYSISGKPICCFGQFVKQTMKGRRPGAGP